MKRELYIIVLSFLFIVACKTQNNSEDITKTKNHKIVSIQPDSNKEIFYSQFIDSIKYIPLESKGNILLSANVFKILCANNCFFVFDETKIFVFDLKGNYLFDFGKKGNGPGEMTWPTDFIIDNTNNSVEILSSGDAKVVRYNLFNGTIRDEFRIGFQADNFYKSNTGAYVFYGKVSSKSSKDELDNLIFFDSTKDSIVFTDLAEPLFKSNYNGNSNNSFSETAEGVLFSRLLDNNIYIIKDNNEIQIRYTFDFKEYNIPDKQESFTKFKYLSDIIRNTEYAVQFSGHFANDSYFLSDFFIKNQDYTFLYNAIHDDILCGVKFQNDIDNGVCFFWVGLNENQIIGIIEPTLFLEHFDKLRKRMGQRNWEDYLSKNSQISSMLESLKPQDNQIIALCYLKEKFQDGKE